MTSEPSSLASDSPAPPKAPPLIQLRDAGRVFRAGEVEVHALRDANLDVRRGELLVIVGPSGSGKSTLLNLLGGMDRPTSGQVTAGSLDLSTASDKQLTAYRRLQVGFVFQFYNLIPNLTALENVTVAAELAEDPMDPQAALDRVGLSARCDHFPAQLSGGEQQRVAIARGLVGRPPLLLCDEPTGALDLDMSRQVLAILRDLVQETSVTVIIITHNLAIRTLADRVVTIRDGRIAEVEENAHPAKADEVYW